MARKRSGSPAAARSPQAADGQETEVNGRQLEILEAAAEIFNEKGYHPPRIKDEPNCCYCQLCDSICPEFALFVTLKEEEEEEGEKTESRP